MPVDKELRKVLRFGVKTLVLQEVRLLQMHQGSVPDIVRDGISQTLEETKREIIRLTRAMGYKERTSLLKRMIQQAVDQEIDRAIELRKHRCLRCTHRRFYDHSETPYSNLPLDENLAQAYGCDKLRPALRKTCRRFTETPTARPIEEYLDGISLLYEFREWVGQVEEIWKDYFNK
ncbi:MAG: hypothetical protein FJ123_15630 [Deltaproteobacteria bacterium]|nr:hypothetical protein [Deltaproteobacteria bacterium]